MNKKLLAVLQDFDSTSTPREMAWDVLSALRGPDSAEPKAEDQKERLTGSVRAWADVLPFMSPSRPEYDLSRTVDRERFFVDLDRVREGVQFEDAMHHYHAHLRYAVMAIEFFETGSVEER